LIGLLEEPRPKEGAKVSIFPLFRGAQGPTARDGMGHPGNRVGIRVQPVGDGRDDERYVKIVTEARTQPIARASRFAGSPRETQSMLGPGSSFHA
jgi:hypothetical protein